jgi:hypothetical protein
MNPYLWLNDLLLVVIGAGLGYLLFDRHVDGWRIHSRARRVRVSTRR